MESPLPIVSGENSRFRTKLNTVVVQSMQDRACHGYIGQAGAREIFTNMCIVRVFWILKTDSFWIALAVSSWPGILPDSRRSINSKRRSTRT